MTPQRHPSESVRAREGFALVYYDDSTSQSIRLDQGPLVRDAAEAAKRAVRCLMPDAQAESIPLSLEVIGLFGETHAIDLLRVQQVSRWPPLSVKRCDDDGELYEASQAEWEPWQG